MKIILKKNWFLLVLTLGLYEFSVKGQTTEEWAGTHINFDLPQKFNLKVSGQSRMLNNPLNLYKYLVQMEAGYKISKRFDVAFIYRSAWKKEEDIKFHYRDKLFAELKFDYPIFRFKMEDRFRYQRQTKTYYDSKRDSIPEHHLRNKFEFAYDIKNSKITPIIFCELFFPLNGNDGYFIDEYRIGAEIKYKITQKQSFKAGVMYKNEQTVFPLSTFLFRFAYSFDIQLFNKNK